MHSITVGLLLAWANMRPLAEFRFGEWVIYTHTHTYIIDARQDHPGGSNGINSGTPHKGNQGVLWSKPKAMVTEVLFYSSSLAQRFLGSMHCPNYLSI